MKWGVGLLLACAMSLSATATYTTKEYKTKHALGLKRNLKRHRAFMMRAERGFIEDVAVPAKFDLTSKVSPPEDQSSCGSCWAFGLTKALRSAWMIAGKDPGTLAFNYLVNNCGPGPKMWGCQGGDFEAGESFLNGAGPWLESQDPYHARDNGRCLNLPAAATAIRFKTVGSGSGAPSFKELAQAVSQNHMLVIDVAVCGDWGSYSGGIFNRNQCGASSINHMINMVGYDCESSKDAKGQCTFNPNGEPSNGDGYLIVMNNWGDWGEKGYMRTRAHVDAIADTAMYFEVDAPTPPPPPPPPPPGPVKPVCTGFLCGSIQLPWCDCKCPSCDK